MHVDISAPPTLKISDLEKGMDLVLPSGLRGPMVVAGLKKTLRRLGENTLNRDFCFCNLGRGPGNGGTDQVFLGKIA
jgi:hypothetical protein